MLYAYEWRVCHSRKWTASTGNWICVYKGCFAELQRMMAYTCRAVYSMCSWNHGCALGLVIRIAIQQNTLSDIDWCFETCLSVLSICVHFGLAERLSQNKDIFCFIEIEIQYRFVCVCEFLFHFHCVYNDGFNASALCCAIEKRQNWKQTNREREQTHCIRITKIQLSRYKKVIPSEEWNETLQPQRIRGRSPHVA